jgi:hypothetical protein
VEELIDGKIVLSMRAIYQSKIGLGLMDKGIVRKLKTSYLFLISKCKLIKKCNNTNQVHRNYKRYTPEKEKSSRKT